MLSDLGWNFSMRSLNRSGLGSVVFNPFKFDTNMNLTQHDTLPNSILNSLSFYGFAKEA